MSLETDLYTALQALASGRMYPDVAPEGTALPYITYQQIGGQGVNFLDPTVPSKKNARVQINVWAGTRLAAANLARSIEDTLRGAASLQVSVLGALTALHEPDTGLYGTRQDFSIWHS